mmetsp:Transcript_43977/g.50611  ORF Transcript_43977/g.50611 Transcript_43977/m.50611 type:complete len:405 (+) Transcript_43977:112-1326(+)
MAFNPRKQQRAREAIACFFRNRSLRMQFLKLRDFIMLCKSDHDMLIRLSPHIKNSKQEDPNCRITLKLSGKHWPPFIVFHIQPTPKTNQNPNTSFRQSFIKHDPYHLLKEATPTWRILFTDQILSMSHKKRKLDAQTTFFSQSLVPATTKSAEIKSTIMVQAIRIPHNTTITNNGIRRRTVRTAATSPSMSAKASLTPVNVSGSYGGENNNMGNTAGKSVRRDVSVGGGSDDRRRVGDGRWRRSTARTGEQGELGSGFFKTGNKLSPLLGDREEGKFGRSHRIRSEERRRMDSSGFRICNGRIEHSVDQKERFSESRGGSGKFASFRRGRLRPLVLNDSETLREADSYFEVFDKIQTPNRGMKLPKSPRRPLSTKNQVVIKMKSIPFQSYLKKIGANLTVKESS